MQAGDGELVRQALAGKTCAFADLVGRYRDMVYGTAFHYLGSFDDAQDVAQEALVQAYLHLADLREPNRFAPWLRRMTVNQCAALRRGRPRPLSLESMEERSLPRSAPGGLAEGVATRLLVWDALARLSEKTRLTVTLAYIGGYSHDEIARFLEIPLATVRSRLQHAKRQLREEMIAMTADVLSQTRPDPEWTRRVVEEALERGKEALRKHATGEAVQFYNGALEELEKADPGADLRRLTLEALRSKHQATALTHSREEKTALLERALALARQIGDREAEAGVLQELARTYRDLQRGDACYREALAIYEERDALVPQGECLLSLGMLHLHAQDIPAGMDMISRARVLFERAGELSYNGVCHALLDLLQSVGAAGLDTLAVWGALSDRIERRDGALRFCGQPGFRVSQNDGSYPASLFVGSIFWQVGHLEVFLDSGVPVGGGGSGAASSFSYQPLQASVTVVSAAESVTVPAGTFQDCLLTEQVTVETGQTDAAPERNRALNREALCGTRRAWYAPGVGLVQLDIRVEKAERVILQLESFCVSDAGADYLPLAVGNTWTYASAALPPGFFARETYRVTARSGDSWFLAEHAYAGRTSPSHPAETAVSAADVAAA